MTEIVERGGKSESSSACETPERDDASTRRKKGRELTTNNSSFPVKTNPVTSISFKDLHLPTTGANATSTRILLLAPAYEVDELDPSIRKVTFSGARPVRKLAKQP